MRRRLVRTGVVAIAALVWSGCASTRAPDGFLGSVDEVQSTAWGSWVVVESDGPDSSLLAGELAAADDDSLFVLQSGGLVGIAKEHVRTVRVEVHQSRHGRYGLWTLLGSITTPSHGVVMLISLPSWVLTGSIITAAVSTEPYRHYDRGKEPSTSSQVDWNGLRSYARYPQGLPPGISRSALEPKRLQF